MTTPEPTPPATPDPVARILAEGPLGMSAAARRLGTFRDGKPTHPSTVTRWVLAGVRLPDGRTLKLEAVRLTGRLVTSWPAVVRFVAAQQPAPSEIVPFPRSPTRRHAASEAAAAELDRLGVKAA